MSAKKVVGFLLCRSAFTQRNATSILLVGLFFAVYVLAGGKITTTLPKMPEQNSIFGGIDGSNQIASQADERNQMPELTQDESKDLLGIQPSEQRTSRQEAINKRGRLFAPEETEEAEKEEIDKSGLIEGADFTNRREQWRLERSEKKPSDTLSAIEERLQIRRRQ